MQHLGYLWGLEHGILLSLVLYILIMSIERLVLLSYRRKHNIMALDVGKLSRETAETEVDFNGTAFAVKYRPNVITTKWIKGMRKAETDQDEDRMVSELTALIADWDLENDGEKLPVTQDTFDMLPLSLTSAIIRSVMREATGGTEEDRETAKKP